MTDEQRTYKRVYCARCGDETSQYTVGHGWICTQCGSGSAQECKMFEEDSRPGYKDDTGKLQYHLVDWPAIEQMIRVLMYGARQPNRGPQNWRKVENAIVRYSDAIHRHMSKLAQGEVFDRESGLPHAAHVMCNAMFLVALGSGSDDNENG